MTASNKRVYKFPSRIPWISPTVLKRKKRLLCRVLLSISPMHNQYDPLLGLVLPIPSNRLLSDSLIFPMQAGHIANALWHPSCCLTGHLVTWLQHLWLWKKLWFGILVFAFFFLKEFFWVYLRVVDEILSSEDAKRIFQSSLQTLHMLKLHARWIKMFAWPKMH